MRDDQSQKHDRDVFDGEKSRLVLLHRGPQIDERETHDRADHVKPETEQKLDVEGSDEGDSRGAAERTEGQLFLPADKTNHDGNNPEQEHEPAQVAMDGQNREIEAHACRGD